MIPVVELRGAIPIAAANGMDDIRTFKADADDVDARIVKDLIHFRSAKHCFVLRQGLVFAAFILFAEFCVIDDDRRVKPCNGRCDFHRFLCRHQAC